MPVGGVSAKVEAAIEAGIKHVIVPRTNINDIVITPAQRKKIDIVPVDHIVEVLKRVIDWKGKTGVLKKIKV